MMGVARRLAVLCLALGGGMLVGCGSEEKIVLPTPTPTVTPTPAPGPVVTFIGLARSDDVVIEHDSVTPEGIKVYTRNPPLTGRQFKIVIEGKPGLSGAEPGTSAYEQAASEFPDLQIIVSQPLGDGSPAVCDFGGPNPEGTPIVTGGVPATDPPRFEPVDTVAPRVNDLSCRFVNGTWQPIGRTESDDSCVREEQSYVWHFVSDESTIQFCTIDVDRFWSFPEGRTLVTARLRDVAGNVGPPAQIYVEVNP